MSQLPEKPNIKFVLSVDTEEEWDWSGPFPQQDFSVGNIDKIPEFQRFCQSLGIKPSYFVDYAVANDPASVAILKQALETKSCEIAAHLHPWCNPPYYGKTGEKESHVVNLPIEQVETKLAELTQKLNQEFGVQPQAFRTGRWGITGEVLALLAKYGYTIDSSVYPFYLHPYFTCQGAPITPYWPDFDNALKTGTQRKLLQLPVTVGFNNKHFHLSNKVHQCLSSPTLSWLRPIGVAWHTGVLRKLYMCPELSNSEEMCVLANKVIERGDNLIHMYMHSSSLVPNVTGFMKEGQGASILFKRIQLLVEHLKQVANVEFLTVSSAAKYYK